MKVTMEIECSPAEARAYWGLPDMGAVNTMLMEQTQDRMKAGAAMFTPQAMMENWMNMGSKAQSNFMRLMTSGIPGAGK